MCATIYLLCKSHQHHEEVKIAYYSRKSTADREAEMLNDKMSDLETKYRWHYYVESVSGDI